MNLCNTPLHSPYTLCYSITMTNPVSVRPLTRKQCACEKCSQFFCDYVYPVLTLAVFSAGFFVVHEVLQPSGRVPWLPTLTIEMTVEEPERDLSEIVDIFEGAFESSGNGENPE